MRDESWKSDAIKHVLAKTGYGICYDQAVSIIEKILKS